MFFKLLYQEVPDVGPCELKHVALCDVTLQCYVGRCVLFVCDKGKHNEMYQDKVAIVFVCESAVIRVAMLRNC